MATNKENFDLVIQWREVVVATVRDYDNKEKILLKAKADLEDAQKGVDAAKNLLSSALGRHQLYGGAIVPRVDDNQNITQLQA